MKPSPAMDRPGRVSGEETDLARRLVDGDEAAFDEVVRAFGPGLGRLAARLLGWQMQDAHDAVQEVFLAVYLRRRSFRMESGLETWLTGITLNRCRAIRRRRAVGLRVLERWLAGRVSSGADDEVDDVGAEVRAAVGRLPWREREVVVLYYLEELPVAEVARLLKITAAAANVRLHRARGRLSVTLASVTGAQAQGDRHE